MKVVTSGHKYTVQAIDGIRKVERSFVNRGNGNDSSGTTNQEVLRVLINRVIYLNKEMPWDGNAKILMHLRSTLILHEARHLERLVEKGELLPENIITGSDGHFMFSITNQH